ALTARAKSMVYEDDEPSAPTVNAPPTASTSLAGAFGLPSITTALKSNDASARVAAVERAAEIAQTATEESARDAAWTLVEGATNTALDDDPDGSLAVRLAAARALSKSPRTEATKALSPLLRNTEPPVKSVYTTPPWGAYGPSPPPYGPFPPYPPYPSPYPYPGYGPSPAVQHKAGKRASADLIRYVRDTAAMSLAVRHDHGELFARLKAKDDPETARAVLQALAAYPAAQSPLEALSGKLEKIELKPDDVALLERIGDVRAADFLYAAAQAEGTLTAGAAMRALARLGDVRVLPIANGLPASARLDVRLAAAEALAILGDPGAEAAIVALSKEPKQPADVKRLAIEFPSAGLLSLIAPVAAQGDAKAIAALGRIGAPAIPKLVELARDDAGPGRDAAAYALAIMPAADLSAISEGSAARKRRAVRAGAVRAARIGSVPSSIKSDAKSLAASSAESDRAAGTLLLSVLDLDRAKDALAGNDLASKKAAATALLSHPRAKAAEVAREHLAAHGATEDPELVRALAGVAARAVDGSVAHDVPISTAILAGWLAEDSAASPIAAFLLAARGGAAVETHVARALVSSSYDVRAAALLGLGVSPDGGAAALLVKQATSVARPSLRRAAIRALAARGSSPTLVAIKRLEPDSEARAIAASAKSVRTPLLSGSEVIEVRVDGPSAPLAASTTADGLTLPILVDPEGFVFVFRAPAGSSEVSAQPKGKGS
ncbi:MAG: hypothetical protein ACXVEE_43290, partial [Polyangiales bacterium]